MTKITKISGFDTGPVLMLDSENTVTVAKGAHLMPGGDINALTSGGFVGTITENVQSPDSVHDNVYTIDGQVIGLQGGVITAGEDDKVTIGSTGSIYAAIGVASVGTHSTITNNGKIIGTFANSEEAGGILVAGVGSKVVNNGFVSGFQGLLMGSSGTEATNGKHGVIYGDLSGVTVADIISGSTGNVKFVNHGHLTGSAGMAFNAAQSHADVTLINDGTLKGSVVFGDGNDTLDNRGGTLDKLKVIGGAGDDTLIVDDSKHVLVEDTDQGNDTVKSTVSYTLSKNVENLFLLGNANIKGTGTADADHIHGNNGNNTLTGLAGADDLYGGKGKDMLIGGADSDTFHFGTGDGTDTVKDFTHMEDTIDVSKWSGMDSLADIKSHAADGDDGVVITKGDDSLTLIGIHKADLANADFHFAM